MAKKEITINDLEQDANGPVWVVNSSGAHTGGRGNIALMIKYNGEPVAVAVPVTWIPINLTEQLPKVGLMQSSEFRRAVQKRQLKLISAEEAQSMLQEVGAEEEMAKVARFSLAGGANANMANINKDETEGEIPGAEQMMSAAVLGIRQQIMEGTSSEVEIINTIRSQGHISLEEFRVIRKAAKEKSLSAVVDFCKKQIETLNNQ